VLKEILEEWVSLAFRKHLKKNIKIGFYDSDIFPFRVKAMVEKMGPNEFFKWVSIADLEALD
jgi:hypothetical protein